MERDRSPLATITRCLALVAASVGVFVTAIVVWGGDADTSKPAVIDRPPSYVATCDEYGPEGDICTAAIVEHQARGVNPYEDPTLPSAGFDPSRGP